MDLNDNCTSLWPEFSGLEWTLKLLPHKHRESSIWHASPFTSTFWRLAYDLTGWEKLNVCYMFYIYINESKSCFRSAHDYGVWWMECVLPCCALLRQEHTVGNIWWAYGVRDRQSTSCCRILCLFFFHAITV